MSKSMALRLLELCDNLSAVSDLLGAVDILAASHEGGRKQIDATSWLIDVVGERLEAAKAELDEIRHAA